MRASQRGNALFRARTQPLRQPRAPTSRHPGVPAKPATPSPPSVPSAQVVPREESLELLSSVVDDRGPEKVTDGRP